MSFLRKAIIIPLLLTSLIYFSSAGAAITDRPPVKVTTSHHLVHKPVHRRLTAHQMKRLVTLVRILQRNKLESYFKAVWDNIYSIPADLMPVVNCIKGVESGNYTESSHTGSGSGAYQYIPSTWKTWFTQWATAFQIQDYYALAYQAPSHVQDGVLVYTLTHGGASNWSGVDGCTGF